MTARPRRRPGLATIEFVMVLPVLMMLCAGIFLVARGSVAKQAAATQARRAAFAARPAAPPGDVFKLTHKPLDSLAAGTAAVRAAPGPLFRGEAFAGESFGFTIGREWDGRDVPFDAVGDWKVHPEPFKLVARNLPGVGEAVVAVVNGTLWLMNPAKNPLLVVAAVVGKVANVLLRVAAVTLKVLLFPVKIARSLAKTAISFLPPGSRLKKKLKKVVGLIDILGTAAENLDNASEGKPVERIGGLDRLRKP